jgi:hypothetical protein
VTRETIFRGSGQLPNRQRSFPVSSNAHKKPANRTRAVYARFFAAASKRSKAVKSGSKLNRFQTPLLQCYAVKGFFVDF